MGDNNGCSNHGCYLRPPSEVGTNAVCKCLQSIQLIPAGRKAMARIQDMQSRITLLEKEKEWLIGHILVDVPISEHERLRYGISQYLREGVR